ncbi:hypothetical protein Barb6XT_01843 [Bacteroidales bacterium Barb6XT]|nr:hypothetical protein Barb6XT_01843 [Bacteroidales bacterium Barb6XT]
MSGDLLINFQDAFDVFGVNMGEVFLSDISAPPPLKDFVENKSRLNNGKEVIFNDPKVDERAVTLTFVIMGRDTATFMANKRAFEAELLKGLVEINVPALGSEVYRLTYISSAAFAMNTGRTVCKLSVKFNESNPSYREY